MATKDMIERFETVIEAETLIKQDDRVSFFEMLTPALVGGIIIGIIAGIPVLSLLIFLYPIGGYVAAGLVKEYYEKKISAKDAVKIGAFTGIIGGFFASLLLLIISIFFANEIIIVVREIVGTTNATMLLTLSGLDPQVSLYTLRLRFSVNVALCAILGAIGGLIFAIRRKK